MPAQLRFAQETIDAALVEPGGVQSHLDAITLDPEKLYALVNTSGLRAYSFSEELYSLFGCVHIKVHCPKVSGCHFIIAFIDGNWTLTDGNGTPRVPKRFCRII